ncbi:glycogen synthase [Pleomorphochaeta sp. DL1XJH-081]|uniref:glycogen synthase n=1 Tax=Pleomorphochaeta sp. DL1XJH-081 TaxID=3409690 RepID=UPI003BB613F8
MRILMVSSEAVPFSKSGGLADVASSLSIALATLGNDVRLVIPGYGLTDDTSFVEMPYRLEVSLGTEVETVRFKQLQYQQVTVYLVDHQWFSKRKGIYGDTSFTPYPDNLIRYTLFSKAALALCKELAWIPEILHCHDWTVGFVPALAQQDPAQTFKQTKSVFTIHNLAYQGDFPRMDLLLADMDIDSRFFSGKGIHKRANMLKNGLETAHVLTTVSPTYAKEIQGELQGCGLETLLLSHADNLYGILNGIDTEEWNPTTDGLLDLHFTAEDLTNKGKLKRIMQKRFGLPVEDATPVVSMISRIADQKGFVELCQGSPCALEQILTDLPVQVLIIGTGDKAIEEKLTTLAELHDNLSVNLIFSNEAAHLVEAGSDFFLMPSRYEPCGLNQMYSLRYGTIPIARRTGGLADSIVDIDEEEGTGILFEQMSGNAIFTAVQRAVSLYHEDIKQISTIRKRGMAVDFSWINSAEDYMKVYETIHKG